MTDAVAVKVQTAHDATVPGYHAWWFLYDDAGSRVTEMRAKDGSMRGRTYTFIVVYCHTCEARAIVRESYLVDLVEELDPSPRWVEEPEIE